MSLTFTDIFCGAGGSSIGLTAAGLDLKLAANHWRTAIDTHAANFPGAEHLCADVNNYDMRALPTTDVLWASPICTEASPAGGSAKATKARPRPRGQLDMFETGGHVPQAGFERTRATFHDVIRATEVHRYAAVLVENVPEVAWKWELFEWWCAGMRQLGYAQQTVCASSAHIGGDGNPYAPQWRDRMYLVFTRTGIPLPDVAPRPLAWCEPCGADVHAVQAWKDTPKVRRFGRIGAYREQYVYLCPNTACGQAPVEPYVMPARAAIDWTDVGERIGDKAKPLAAATIARIRHGLEMFTDRQSLITVNHGDSDSRALPIGGGPLPTRTLKIGEGFATPPMLVPAGGRRQGDQAWPVDTPMRTRLTRESEAVVTPAPFVAVLRRNGTAHSTGQPFQTMAAGGGHHALVIPYRKGNRPTSTDAPLHTMATHDSGALLRPAVQVEDCYFRMLKPREQLRAQRFPDTYQVRGNVSEQTMQAGNAVSANVAQFLGGRVALAMDSRCAS
ncbi:DNA cytosine methyltransferase [Catellatospora sp. NPDC049609]|uniref:DNA cytosine methyltransferase n=1 Tax=Catellatospora sp. NPDC049609 TaxID=3155505 RepID=UPI00343C48D3